MGFRYWASFAAFSILLHAALFWPLPAPSFTSGSLSPLSVSLLDVRPAALPSDSHGDSHPAPELGPEATIQKTEIQVKASSKKPAVLEARKPIQALSNELLIPPNAGSGAGKARLPDNRASASAEVANPSISSYRLALALEVIRKRALVERFVAPEFKGELVVVVSLRGPDATPQVSLEEAAGSEPLEREILSVFGKAVEAVPVSIAGDVGEVAIRLPVRFDPAGPD
ncbi:MAG: hypothetical protein PHW25_00005 [Zoogloea sp.]|jgi:hypothetical protein|uniref:hypothetical protein n=1 Tax=Zoogloea sp. TaxID=49181 RepID=UPI00260F50D4|nr:hypothetical protein [Zoogloea sp.]MDD3325451.1 hypothetical protein [Zoogloea sp.]